jgi:hypothetical protein
MKLDAFKKRLVDWVETDWKSRAMKLGSDWREHAVELHREKGERLTIVSCRVSSDEPRANLVLRTSNFNLTLFTG